MAGANIEAARQKTKAFLEQPINPSFVPLLGEMLLYLDRVENFPAYITAEKEHNDEQTWDLTSTKEIIDSNMSQRQFLNMLGSSNFLMQLPDESMRKEVARLHPAQYKEYIAGLRDGPADNNAADYFNFIDAMAAFADGGAAPSPAVLRKGIAILQNWEKKFSGWQADAKADKRNPDALENQTILSEAYQMIIVYNFTKHFPDGTPPDYFVPEIISGFKDLHEKFQRLGDADYQEEKQRFLNNVLIPFMKEHRPIKAADYRDAAANTENLRAGWGDQTELYRHLIDQTCAIAESLGVPIETTTPKGITGKRNFFG